MVKEIKLKGTGVFPDVGVGKAIVLEDTKNFVIPIRYINEDEIEPEKERFLSAIQKTEEQILGLRDSMSDSLSGSHLAIFDAHILILKDSTLTRSTLEIIENEKCNAECAFEKIVKKLQIQLASIDDPYLKQKKDDIEDISNRVVGNLLNIERSIDKGNLNVDQPTIIVANVIHPSDLSLLNSPLIKGLATDLGGVTTHTSIIAKALELPAVVGLHNVTTTVNKGDTIVVDGIAGEVIINPEELEEKAYADKHAMVLTADKEYIEISKKETVTLDGEKIYLQANIELENEIKNIKKYRTDGIGLYRSEFIFLTVAPSLPTEEEHYNFYKRLVNEVDGEIVIRTLDLGGEKFFHQVLDQGNELNPVLGLRAVRFCMKRKGIFRTQLKAILRASALTDRIKIMFPLISSVDELKEVLSFFEQVKNEMSRDGINYNRNISTGVMIEVPSAAVVADLMARYVDFFSIGTNDLIQYFLAIDRSNDEVSYLYQPLHPGILRMLSFTINSAQKRDISVSMCGEMAGNPFYTVLLLGLGLRKFSMTPTSTPIIKTIVRNVSIKDCQSIADKILEMESASEINSYLWIKNIKLIPDFEKTYLKCNL